jgi:hypothetical protein
MRAPVYGLAGGDQRANVSLHSITLRETGLPLRGSSANRAYRLGNSVCVVVSVLCVCLEKAQSIFLELHGILGTAQMGLQGLDALFQMSRRQMSISQGHSYVAMPSQCGNFR